MNARRLLPSLTAAFILTYFLLFTLPSIRIYFDSDDLYALYFAWSKPMMQVVRENLYLWKGEFRPFGAFFYRGLLAVAGFHPRPFRISALAVCLFDTWLCFWFARLISKSEATAALAALLFSFQAGLVEVWYRTTVIFDTLCFTFAYLTVGLYIKARQDGGDVTWYRAVLLLALFVCALNSKEFAVTVPVFLVAWELLFNVSAWRGWLKSRATLTILVMGVLTLIYTYGKLHGAQSMTANPTYTPQYTYARFTETWGEYLKDIFLLGFRPAGPICLAILGGMLVLALAIRSRVLVFAWVIAFFGMLPVSFSPARGGYEIFFCWLGWTVYAAALLVALQELLTRRAPQRRTVVASVTFALVALSYGFANWRALKTEDRPWLYASPDSIRQFVTEMRAMHRRFPRGARMMFLDDGIGWGEYTPLFIMRVLYNDPAMVVDRLKQRSDDKPAGWTQYLSDDHVHYDYVFSFNGQQYLEVPAEIAAFHGLEVTHRHAQ